MPDGYSQLRSLEWWRKLEACRLLTRLADFEHQIIGQGGPTNAQFAALWADIATRTANNPKIIYGM